MKIFIFIVIFSLLNNADADDGQISNLNNIDIWWETHGDYSNPPVLMIMGLNSNLKRWPTELIEGLVNQGFSMLLLMIIEIRANQLGLLKSQPLLN